MSFDGPIVRESACQFLRSCVSSSLRDAYVKRFSQFECCGLFSGYSDFLSLAMMTGWLGSDLTKVENFLRVHVFSPQLENERSNE